MKIRFHRGTWDHRAKKEKDFKVKNRGQEINAKNWTVSFTVCQTAIVLFAFLLNKYPSFASDNHSASKHFEFSEVIPQNTLVISSYCGAFQDNSTNDGCKLTPDHLGFSWKLVHGLLQSPEFEFGGLRATPFELWHKTDLVRCVIIVFTNNHNYKQYTQTPKSKPIYRYSPDGISKYFVTTTKHFSIFIFLFFWENFISFLMWPVKQKTFSCSETLFMLLRDWIEKRKQLFLCFFFQPCVWHTQY